MAMHDNYDEYATDTEVTVGAAIKLLFLTIWLSLNRATFGARVMAFEFGNSLKCAWIVAAIGWGLFAGVCLGSIF